MIATKSFCARLTCIRESVSLPLTSEVVPHGCQIGWRPGLSLTMDESCELPRVPKDSAAMWVPDVGACFSSGKTT